MFDYVYLFLMEESLPKANSQSTAMLHFWKFTQKWYMWESCQFFCKSNKLYLISVSLNGIKEFIVI